MKFPTAASIAVLAIASGLGLADAQAEPGAQLPGQGAQQHQQTPRTEAQSQGGQSDLKQAGTIQAREPDMVLVSNLWNASVYGADEQRIGDINDIIIKSDGKIEGVVVGVGGFLGLGEKNVALKLDRFKVMPEQDGRARIVVSAKREELQEAPEFKAKQDQGSQQQKPQQQGKS
jgi:sporulation protein YlmC with PRC-barrel domain